METNQPELEGEILRTVIQHKPNYQHFSHDHLHSLLVLTHSPDHSRHGQLDRVPQCCQNRLPTQRVDQKSS